MCEAGDLVGILLACIACGGTEKSLSISRSQPATCAADAHAEAPSPAEAEGTFGDNRLAIPRCIAVRSRGVWEAGFFGLTGPTHQRRSRSRHVARRGKRSGSLRLRASRYFGRARSSPRSDRRGCVRSPYRGNPRGRNLSSRPQLPRKPRIPQLGPSLPGTNRYRSKRSPPQSRSTSRGCRARVPTEARTSEAGEQPNRRSPGRVPSCP